MGANRLFNVKTTPAKPSTPAERRRKIYIDAAREAFFAQGYAATTMSSIASMVGGSKTTLWAYFPAKEELFSAVVDDLVEQYGSTLAARLPLDRSVHDVLRDFGEALLIALIDTPLLSLFRLIVGEAERFPHLAATFYDLGPRRGRARLADWIVEKMVRGELRIGDPMNAVSQFMGLCQSGAYYRAVLGLKGARDNATISTELDAVVNTFCRAWCTDEWDKLRNAERPNMRKNVPC